MGTLNLTTRQWALIASGVVAVVAALVAVLLIGNGSDSQPNAGAEGGTMSLDQPVESSDIPKHTGRRLPPVRHSEPYIVIDRYCNRLYLRTNRAILLDALCSTGSNGELTDETTGRQWQFNTPPGAYAVHTLLKDPWWRKPDWAYVEENEPIPEKESARLDNEMLGDYAIGFGDGYYVHGTIYERLLGKAVTHGCVRLGGQDLKTLFGKVRVGTPVYVY